MIPDLDRAFEHGQPVRIPKSYNVRLSLTFNCARISPTRQVGQVKKPQWNRVRGSDIPDPTLNLRLSLVSEDDLRCRGRFQPHGKYEDAAIAALLIVARTSSKRK